MDDEVDRQRNLINTRNQLEVLQDLWPKLIGEGQVAGRSMPTKKRPPPRKKRARRQIAPPGSLYAAHSSGP